MRCRTVALLLVVLPLAARADDRASRQAELDRACEAAREEALGPIREELREDCLADGKDAAFCRRQAEGYNGARAGGGAPLFYDLPACAAAFEYQRGQRRPQ